MDASLSQHNVTIFGDNPIDNMACLLTDHFSNDLTGRNRAGKLLGSGLRTSDIA